MKKSSYDIAIVGIGGLFPECEDLKDFWDMIENGKYAFKHAPKNRWILDSSSVISEVKTPNKAFTDIGAFISEDTIQKLCSKYGIEDDNLDPVFKITAIAGKSAFKECNSSSISADKVGVILGSIALPTETSEQISFDLALSDCKNISTNPINSLVNSHTASFLAKTIGAEGESFTLDAACASSLYAVKLACDRLVEGKADLMLAGGVSRPDCMYTSIGFTQLSALSTDGICAPFDKKGKGLVTGEGAGIICLKRVEDAIKDGDKIYGVIKAVGLSNDREGSLLMPSQEGQLRAMKEAYEQANLLPSDIDLFECHATGTPAGDKVEFGSLCKLFSEFNCKRENKKSALGSVKSNIGHLLTGAGGAGLVKVLLSMQKGILPPIANYSTPSIDIENSPFFVPTKAEKWDSKTKRVAVSAFGFGGINAHVIIEEFKKELYENKKALNPQKNDKKVAVVGIDVRVGNVNNAYEFEKMRAEGKYPSKRTFEDTQIPFGKIKIPPKELDESLPQQKAMLLSAISAMSDADIKKEEYAKGGVFIGINFDFSTTDFYVSWRTGDKVFSEPLNANRTMGALGSITASRIAREFGFGKTSHTVSESENGGLEAVSLAFDSLVNFETDVVIAGCTDIASDDRFTFCKNMMSKRNDKFFDTSVCFVLKRYDDAVRDKNKIYAVIDNVSKISPRDEKESQEKNFVNGNYQTSSLDKVDRIDEKESQVKNGALELAEKCLFIKDRFEPISKTYRLSNRIEGKITDSATSFSSITNRGIKIDISEPPCEPEHLHNFQNKEIFFFASKNEKDLKQKIDSALKFLSETDLTFSQSALYLEKNREKDTDKDIFRASILAKDFAEFKKIANTFPEHTEGLTYNDGKFAEKGKIAFVFPGSGNHYAGMGKELALRFPNVMYNENEENLRLKDQILPNYFWTKENLDGVSNNHPALLQGQTAMSSIASDCVANLGIKPNASIGYSLGEMAGITALRIWHSRDEMMDRLNSSSLFIDDLAGEYNSAKKVWNIPENEKVDWLTAVIACNYKKAQKVIEKYDRVYLLIINTYEDCVIGGERKEVEKCAEELKCTIIPIEGVTSVHCEVLKPVAQKYRDLHYFPAENPNNITFYSTALKKSYDITSDNIADTILKQASYTIDFPAVIEQAWKDGIRVFIEVGPSCSCTRMIDSILSEKPHLAVYATKAGFSEIDTFLNMCAVLFVNGIDFEKLNLFDRDFKETKKSNLMKISLSKRAFSEKSSEYNSKKTNSSKTIEQRDNKLSKEKESKPVISQNINNEHRENFINFRDKEVTQNELGSIYKQESKEKMPQIEISQTTETANSVLKRIFEMEQKTAEAHGEYLNFSQDLISLVLDCPTEISQNIYLGNVDRRNKQESQKENNVYGSYEKVSQNEIDRRDKNASQEKNFVDGNYQTSSRDKIDRRDNNASDKKIFMDREACMEFATGSIGKVLGKMFEEIDSYPTRVRLPDEPLMLADRILSVSGEPLSLTSGSTVTEHDIKENAWYLDNGIIPTCVAVEAGQSDLFLSGWLGIDKKTKGLAVYRLLNASIQFHDHLPKVGETIRYEINIERFFTQGSVWLFYFNFESFVGTKKLMSMTNGCAGFFTQQQLDEGKGIIHTALDLRPEKGLIKDGFKPFVPMYEESYADTEIAELRKGKISACFGSSFDYMDCEDPLTLPRHKYMKLLDRVINLNPTGGRFGIGSIESELDIHPDDWFLTCHFSDDNVMPGTLMYECCMHTLRIFLMRAGWIDSAKDTVWEPIQGVSSSLKCRGQVIESTKKSSFRISIKEIGYNPYPYAIADALMFADGKPIVEMLNMSIQLKGSSKERLEKIWRNIKNVGKTPQTPVFDNASITAFAIGNPSEAFGSKYAVFDKDRIIARLPGDPYKFLDRIVKVAGEQWVMKTPASASAQYDMNGNEWYFEQSSSSLMPFSVLLEVALQPCGWLAAYVGSALTENFDLSFRNLGGYGHLERPVNKNTKILHTDVKLETVSKSAGMVIQNYFFDVYDEIGSVYKGWTYFGFFSKEALKNQIGILDAKIPPVGNDKDSERNIIYPEHRILPKSMLKMIDNITVFAPHGGPKGLGYIEGTMKVRPSDWFFKAHFYQDPVIPGSLGLESMISLMKYMSIKFWSKEAEKSEGFISPLCECKHLWTYRGQVIPKDDLVTVRVWVTSKSNDDKVIICDGWLSVDGRNIYKFSNFALKMI